MSSWYSISEVSLSLPSALRAGTYMRKSMCSVRHGGCGSQEEISHAPKEGCYYFKYTNMRWVVALSWGMGLGHGVGANWNRPHEVNLKIPTCCLNFDLNFPNWEIGTLKLRLLVTGVEGRVEGQVGHVWTSLMVQTRCLSPKTWQWKFNVYLQG